MTVPAGTNCLTRAEDALAGMLAAAPTFIDWIESRFPGANPADHIHIDGLPLPAGDEYSIAEQDSFARHAIVSTSAEGGFGMVVTAVGSSYEMGPFGTLEASFSQRIDSGRAAEISEVPREFRNFVVNLLEEISNASGSGLPNLAIRQIGLDEVYRNGENEIPSQGDLMVARTTYLWDQGDRGD